MMQALVSGGSLVQVVLLAGLLSRSGFDDFSVWYTAALFALGLTQCVGSERVLIGRRSGTDGADAAVVLGLLMTLVCGAVAVYVGSWVLLACSAAMYPVTRWDYHRIVDGARAPGRILLVDLPLLLVQGALLVLAPRMGAPGWLLPLLWWLPAALAYVVAVRRFQPARPCPRRGLRVLRDDLRESTPLLADAVLTGAPLLATLMLVRELGTAGAAADARLAVSLLGPVTVIGLAVRRLVYARLATGEPDRRTWAAWGVLVVLAAFGSFVMLALSATPAYDLVLPGFGALGWVAICWFALDRSSIIAATMPAGLLRTRGHAGRIGAARAVAVLAAVAAGVACWPIATVEDVAVCTSVASIVFAAILYVEVRRGHGPAPRGPARSAPSTRSVRADLSGSPVAGPPR